jgi:hypothetical protein
LEPLVSEKGGVAEICRRLDCLLLALELAARVKVLSSEASHVLNGQAEQELFVRLAMFTGGGMLEAAEQVCEAKLDLLQSLVEKSLVRQTDA